MAKRIYTEHPELKRLDKYSKKIAQKVYNMHPEWLLHSRVESHDDECFLAIYLQAPIHSSERDMIILTYGQKITVHFDLYHGHFGVFQETTIDEAFQEAVTFIEGIFREDIIVAIKMENGTWKGSSLLLATDVDTVQPSEVTYTRSWLGTYKQNYESRESS